VRIHGIGFGFLQPYCAHYAEFVDDPAQADFVLAMNNGGIEGEHIIWKARQAAQEHDIPFCWWTIEDPNCFHPFLRQSQLADYVFTSDGALVAEYRQRLGHNRVYWLPLACCDGVHQFVQLISGTTQFVFSGNWYDPQWAARRWGTETVLLPIAKAGHGVTVFSLEEPPYPELRPGWIGPNDPRSPGYFSAVAQQYAWGKIVLGQNNQRSGFDGRPHTWMTSMRTFEALGCGKPFLAPWSEAYERLGLQQNVHMVWSQSPEETLEWADHLLNYDCQAASMAKTGQQFVMDCHTYGRRMERIMRAINGEAEPEDWA
jgi:spore maturation protein CgeB